jgi:hypothetical protein
MPSERRFVFRNVDWTCSLEFFPDYLEYSWDNYGLGVEKGKKTFLRQELSFHLRQGTGRYAYTGLRLPAIYLTLTIISYAWEPQPWRFSAYLFLILFLLSGYRFLFRLKKRNWIRIIKKNGDSAVDVQMTKWNREERKQFISFYSDWHQRSTEE